MTEHREPTLVDPAGTLHTVAELIAGCRARDIRVCHWKSNSHLDAALRGATDLDLLVDAAQRRGFLDLLAELAIKPVAAAPGKDYPGVENHVGHDEATGRLFHLHVHYALVLGQQHVKDFRLPLEAEFLDHRRTLLGVPVPIASLELIVLSMRAVLKYRLRDAIKDVLGVRSSGIPDHIRAEVAWLAAEADRAEMDRLLAGMPAEIPGDAIFEFLESVPEEHPGTTMLRLRSRVRRSLRPYRRVGRLAASVRYALALVRKRILKRGRIKRRMTLPASGLRIAVVGADGAGKSAVVTELANWLGARLTVRTEYMGTARPSPATRGLKYAAKGARTIHRRVQDGSPQSSVVGVLTRNGSELLVALRRVSEANDRLRRDGRSRRESARGVIVLFDRYPLPGAPIGSRTVDGPRITAETAGTNRVVMWLAEHEERLLSRVQRPDALIVLNVDPDVSLQRSPDHDPHSINEKVAAINAMDRATIDHVDVDANRPLNEVMERVRRAVWSRL